MPNHRSRGEREQRLRDVMRMIGLMFSNTEIISQLRAGTTEAAARARDEGKPPPPYLYDKVSERQARYDIESAYARLEQEGAIGRPMRVHRVRSSLELVFRRAIATNDLPAAVACCDRMCKIDGLYAPTTLMAAMQIADVSGGAGGNGGVAPPAALAPSPGAIDLSMLDSEDLVLLERICEKADQRALPRGDAGGGSEGEGASGEA